MVQFADDIAIYARSSDVRGSLRALERTANNLSQFLLSRGLSVSPAKSALIVFSRKRISPLSYSITLDGITINSSRSHRFLGVLLDHSLGGQEHVRGLADRCGKLANILKALSGVWWGADPRTLLGIFKALVRRSVEYGALIFPTRNGGLTELLERALRRALRCCVGLRRTTPTNVVYAETGIGPIRHRFTCLTTKFVLRSLALRDNILIEKLCDLQAALFNNNRYDLINRFPLYGAFCSARAYRHRMASFTRVPLYLFSYETSSFIPRTEVTPCSVVEDIRLAPQPWLVFQSSLSHLIKERHLIFTDASKEESGDHVGIGIFSPTLHIRRKYKIDGYSSVFSGECIATIHATELALENCVGRATIFTDSRSVVDIVSSNRIDRDHNYLVLVLKNKLRSAFLQGMDIILAWIPAHVGIPGNEAADRLASEAIGGGESSEYLPPHSDFLAIPRKRYIETVQNFLTDQATYKGSQYFRLHPAFLPDPWFAKSKLNRTEIVTVSRIRSNHYNLNYSLNRCGIVGSPACDCGAPQQDINHALWHCPLFGGHRGPLLRSIQRSLGSPPPYDVFDLLREPSYEIIASIVSFL